MEFSFDNQKQTIMNIKIDNFDVFSSIRDAMLFNVFEGWKPTQKDVNWLIQNSHTDCFDKARFIKIFKIFKER